MALRLVRRAVIAAKLEATAGTDPMGTPGTADAGTQLLVGNRVWTPEAEEVNREIISPHLSSLGFVVGASWGTLSFMTELRGRGAIPTSASPLRDNPLWVGCAMSPSYDPGSSAVYSFRTDLCAAEANATVTLYAFLDGMLHILNYGRGTPDINAQCGRFGMINWSFTGLWKRIAGVSAADAGIVDAALPAAAYDNFSLKPPPVLGCQFNSHGFSAVIQSMTWAANNQVVRRPSCTADNGIAGTVISGRDVGGSINPEAVLRATHDFWQRWQNGTTGAIDMRVGSTSGNRVRVRNPTTQYRRPQYGDREGIRTYEIPYMAVASADAGDDETQIIFD